MRVGFVGLGMMGLPMAENLARRPDIHLVAFDRALEAREKLTAHPAFGTTLAVAESLHDLAACEIVVLMLPDSSITNAVVLGGGGAPGLADLLGRGALVIDMGSSNPADTRMLEARLAAASISLADAPVSGAVAKAKAGTLSILFGGGDAAFERSRPVLEGMGTTLIRAGGVSAGHAMKAINNYVYAAGLLAVSEALLMGRTLGLDASVLASVLNASSGRNVASETKLAQFMIPETYAGGFALKLQAKDLGIVATMLDELEVDAPQVALCAALWREASAALGPKADNTEIYRFLERGRNASAHKEEAHAAD